MTGANAGLYKLETISLCVQLNVFNRQGRGGGYDVIRGRVASRDLRNESESVSE